jgi:hypothetical protein
MKWIKACAVIGTILLCLAFIVMACPIVLGFATALALTWAEHQEVAERREQATPLEPEVVADLCRTFAATVNPLVCQPGNEVYAPDFFPAIKKTFEPGVSTYSNIYQMLGQYEYLLSPPTTDANGITSFSSSYDLHGDRVTCISFLFTGEGVLKRIIFDGWDSDFK